MTTDNRTKEPTPEQVEAAAKGIHALTEAEPFEDYHHSHKQELRDMAHAALVAAQGAAPQAEPEAVDEEQIVATVLAELEEHRATGDTGGWGTTFHRHGLSNEIHRGVDDCGRGTGKPVYVFDPDYLEEHDEWVIQATLRTVAGAAPVLPSSGVDEDALAEVIEDTIRVNWEVFNNRKEEAQIIARAVAEWLKEQGR